MVCGGRRSSRENEGWLGLEELRTFLVLTPEATSQETLVAVPGANDDRQTDKCHRRLWLIGSVGGE